jgi:hypothetical protein
MSSRNPSRDDAPTGESRQPLPGPRRISGWLRRKLTAHAGPGWCNKRTLMVELFESYAALTLRGHAVPGVPKSNDY